jgi:hypothetical protein
VERSGQMPVTACCLEGAVLVSGVRCHRGGPYIM